MKNIFRMDIDPQNIDCPLDVSDNSIATLRAGVVFNKVTEETGGKVYPFPF